MGDKTAPLATGPEGVRVPRLTLPWERERLARIGPCNWHWRCGESKCGRDARAPSEGVGSEQAVTPAIGFSMPRFRRPGGCRLLSAMRSSAPLAERLCGLAPQNGAHIPPTTA